MSEAQRIALLAGIFGAPPSGVTVGIGDDAAVFAPPREPLVVSVDAAVEHVHFERRWLAPSDIGYRATMAALSDLAAMGARPLGVLSALVLPADVDDAFLEELARGQRRAADALGTAIVGGNLSRGGELSVTTTVLGACARPLRRDGATPGDVVWLAGPVGLARVGLEVLLRGGPVEPRLIEAFRTPRARIEAGLAAAAVATAAIDVSDGLALDAARVAEASEVAMVFEGEALLDAELLAAAGAVGLEPLEAALFGGEDYALLVTAPRGSSPGADFRAIGHTRARTEAERAASAWVSLRVGGVERPLAHRGFDHFS